MSIVYRFGSLTVAAAMLVATGVVAPFSSAQEGTPATPVSISTPQVDACETLFGGVATPIAVDPNAEVPEFGQIPGDLLAIDALITHHDSVIALLQVTISHSQNPDVVALATTELEAFQADRDALLASRNAWFAGSPPVPIGYQVALLDQSRASAGMNAGSGEDPPRTDPLISSRVLCGLGDTAPFDLGVIDLLSVELQDLVSLGLLVTGSAEQADLQVLAQAMTARETATIGQLATWRDAWFGPDAEPVVVPPEEGHEHGH